MASHRASSVGHWKLPVTFGAWNYADVGLDAEGAEGLGTTTTVAAAAVQVGILVAKSHPTYEVQPLPHPWAADDAKSAVRRAGQVVEARPEVHCGERVVVGYGSFENVVDDVHDGDGRMQTMDERCTHRPSTTALDPPFRHLGPSTTVEASFVHLLDILRPVEETWASAALDSDHLDIVRDCHVWTVHQLRVDTRHWEGVHQRC